MNISPTLTICCTLIIIGSGIVAAQVKPPSPEYEAPPDHQLESYCHELMVKQLYAATDVTDPAQDRYLKAAEAYKELDKAGQRCQ